VHSACDAPVGWVAGFRLDHVREQLSQQMPIGCGQRAERSPDRAMMFETPTMLGLCCINRRSIGKD
jgi:hypothetical protein